MNLLVIEEKDPELEKSIIGVAYTIDDVKKMLSEYYGEYELIDTRDVRDSGIEYIYNIVADNDDLEITVRRFKLNEI